MKNLKKLLHSLDGYFEHHFQFRYRTKQYDERFQKNSFSMLRDLFPLMSF